MARKNYSGGAAALRRPLVVRRWCGRTTAVVRQYSGGGAAALRRPLVVRRWCGKTMAVRLKPPPISQKRLLFCRASGSQKGDSGNEFPFKVGNAFAEEAIGAEYGEGFETFRLDGPLMLDVDYLNERLQECFLQRIRHAMKPDEAFGLVFSWDNVVADTRSLKLDAWRRLASEEGREIPTAGHVHRTIVNTAADHVLQKVLCWEKEVSRLEKLKSRLSHLYYQNLLKLDTPIKGLREWLDALYTAGTPCAVVSCLDRKIMLETLERMGISKYFQHGFEYLRNGFGFENLESLIFKIDISPSCKLFFEVIPRGITAAHNCTMMAVALIGCSSSLNLGQADLAVASYNELSVINLKRLFAHKGSNFMDLQKQIITKKPPQTKLSCDPL
ncbi:hypothetical protein MA16_Dca015670 [Dendrobium catenatum]|uniref:Uncharacterized protein n=1 Tax=Dendrobium catenatum TaxID=906689 RepID=A0A2I0WZU7_9ASPA|nr:hypothetical protein MA16_Dca015670 [Dendrobium catenatum]